MREGRESERGRQRVNKERTKSGRERGRRVEKQG